MCELDIKSNMWKDSPDNAQESELNMILWQDTMRNSKSHLILLSVF